jgi:hypothetical protein
MTSRLMTGAAFALLALIAAASVWDELWLFLGDPIVALMLVLLVTVLLMPLAGRRDA